MGYRPTKATLRNLVALAQRQGGYFTAKQAADVGYAYTHLGYHVRAGNFERAGHGIYRLPEIPLGEHDDLVRLALWSRGRTDRPLAIVSHQTALGVHGLSDLLPSKIHLSVPLNFRKAAPQGIVLHRGPLMESDIEEREGFQVTTPLRTLVDVSGNDGISEEQLGKAIAEALARGIVRKSNLTAAAKKSPAGNRLSRVLASLS